MKIISPFFVIALISLSSYSQNFKDMTIFKNDNTQINVSGIFIYENNLIKRIRLENSESNLNSSYLPDLENITKVVIGKNVFLVKKYNSKKHLFLQISNGALSLYKDKKKYYLENQKFGLKEVQKKEHLSKTIFNPGEVSLFINNCKLAVNKLQQRATNLTLGTLKKIINTYNNCNLSSEIQIADSVVEKSMKPKEKIKLGVSLGLMNLNTNYNKIIAIDTDNLNLISVGAKAHFHSNMLDNNLDFNFAVDYFFEGKQTFDNSEYTAFSKIQFTKTMLGVNYIFANLETKIRPYIGISGGMLFNTNSTIHLISKISSLPSLSYKVNSVLTYSVNTGAVFKIFNKNIDFLIEYQPSLDLSFLKSSDLNLGNKSYNFSSLSFRMTYIF